MKIYYYPGYGRFILLFLLFYVCFRAGAQDNIQRRSYDSLYLVAHADSLRKIACNNIEELPSNDLAVLIALSHYPELASTKIRFSYRKIGTTMNCRPTTGSWLFRGRSHRTYVIRINSDTSAHAIRFNEVPFEAAIGLVGHELAHILDYSQKGFFGVAGRGIAYLSKGSRASYEKEIDRLTLCRGLGWQLYAWTCYVQYKSPATESYKAYKRRTYLGPDEVAGMLREER